jgi:hypothetical protein
MAAEQDAKFVLPKYHPAPTAIEKIWITRKKQLNQMVEGREEWQEDLQQPLEDISVILTQK